LICVWALSGSLCDIELTGVILFDVFRLALANMPPLSLSADSSEKPAIITGQMLDDISTFLYNLAQLVAGFPARQL